MGTVQLDTTLGELYRDHGIKGPFIVTMYCVFGHLDLHPNFPRELVYPEDEEPVPFSEDAKEQDRLKRIILGLKPLRRAFGLGNMEVIFLGPNATAAGMNRALLQLAPKQRHRPVYLDLYQGHLQKQLHEACQGKKLLFWRPQGWMKEHDCLINPQEGYEINSKKFLITSGIKTPRSVVANLQDIDLNGSDTIFAARSLPFVLKLCRAGCGYGTYVVTSESHRSKMLEAMKKYKQRGVTEVLVSDYIDLVQDLAVHFLIGAADSEKNHDNPLILGITRQTLTPDGKWVGGHIDYSEQEDLESLVMDTVRDTAQRMPRSYVGWAGIDIVVDREGQQWVVDLNARFTGSMPICFMSQHFWKKRGLPLAQFGAFGYAGDVDDIYTRLRPLLDFGQIIVTATAEIYQGDNMADIVWGGRDIEDLHRVQKWIKEKLTEA
ncbi:putative ATP-grasp domain-containing protein [Seiridium cardinale]|uniref:ATP-grasp domain-containing protein n=1 Tax=Seiridium cardinale TaxID=138064 RepID=A0ABR2Y7S6_9PEZI